MPTHLTGFDPGLHTHAHTWHTTADHLDTEAASQPDTTAVKTRRRAKVFRAAATMADRGDTRDVITHYARNSGGDLDTRAAWLAVLAHLDRR